MSKISRYQSDPWARSSVIAALVENGFITGVVLPCGGGLRLT